MPEGVVFARLRVYMATCRHIGIQSAVSASLHGCMEACMPGGVVSARVYMATWLHKTREAYSLLCLCVCMSAWQHGSREAYSCLCLRVCMSVWLHGGLDA